MNEEKKQSPQDILKLPQDINGTNIIPRRVISIFHLKQCPKSCRVHHSYCSQSSSHPYRIASQSTKFKIKENNLFPVLILIIQIHFYCTQRWRTCWSGQQTQGLNALATFSGIFLFSHPRFAQTRQRSLEKGIYSAPHNHFHKIKKYSLRFLPDTTRLDWGLKLQQKA